MTLKTLVRILILILCVIVLMRPETAEPRQPPIAHIPDANLRAAINTALNDWYLEMGYPEMGRRSPHASIFGIHMQRLTELSAEYLGISDLIGLEHATYLTKLNLSGNSLVDVSSLATLKNLTRLELSHNAIVDVSSLATLQDWNFLTTPSWMCRRSQP